MMTIKKFPTEICSGVKSESSQDSFSDEAFNKSDLTNIKLYMYEWTVSNFSMIKPVPEAVISPIFDVGPSRDCSLKIILSPISEDNMKIEVELSKEVRATLDEKETYWSSKITKNILGLEFLDSNKKTIDYYKGLPYEFKYVNTSKVFTWKKEENVSRFVQNDTLTVRVKLSVRYYSNSSQNSESSSAKSSRLLIKDMKTLFLDRSSFPDFVVKAGGQLFLTHKPILFAQCPHFIEMLKCDSDSDSSDRQVSVVKLPTNVCNSLKEGYEMLSIPNVNSDVFSSVLHFLYCGEIYTSDTVNDFAVYEFAKKYGVRQLSMLLMPTEMYSASQIKLEKVRFTWYVKNFSSLRKGNFAPLQSPSFKTTVELDIEWNLVLFHLDSQNIILSLQRLTALNSNVQTSFTLAVCQADGSLHDERKFKHLFASNDIANCYPGLMNSVSRFLIAPQLLFNDTLAVSCDLIVSNGGLVSELKHSSPGQCHDIDLSYWAENFQKILDNEKFSDVTLFVDDKEFKVHKAILATRSPVFARMFASDMEEKHSGFVRIDDIDSVVMKLVLIYMYTGKVVDLSMKHVADAYRAADKYEILDLRERCSEFIMKNMDADSACEILILADLYNDEKMKNAAKNIICRNAAQALLSPQGFDLMTNHSNLAHDILESLSAVYCSLPPQDIFGSIVGKPPTRIMKKVISVKSPQRNVASQNQTTNQSASANSSTFNSGFLSLSEYLRNTNINQ